MLELVALSSDAEQAAAVASDLGGTSYRCHDDEPERRPYSAMVRVVTDRAEAVAAIADVGLYTAFARPIKMPAGPPSPDRVVASFGLVRHPDLTHTEADAHWREVHGPLALRCHTAMCDYTQLSVVAVHRGLKLDGLALCAFKSRPDMRQRFFDDSRARAEIEADVASFADVRRSPRRVVLTENFVVNWGRSSR